jgi:hypothetical protein
MPDFPVEQALFRREHERPPRLVARSPGFADDWLPDAERLILGFGERTGGVSCPLALFAFPLSLQYIAVVQVADQEPGAWPPQPPIGEQGGGERAAEGWRALAFRILVIRRNDWVTHLGDPFVVARRWPAEWTAPGSLPGLRWSSEPLPPRSVAQVQAVLKRVKAYALREDEDPELKVERTVENSESPSLLGGAQVLVDGGKLVFVRRAPDPGVVEALWTLLPHSLRSTIWPATFVFSNALGFDVVVVPRAGEEDWDGYTTEEQAADYPAGSYELALQTAAESGDQAELDAVFTRRTSGETLSLAVKLLIFMALLVLAGRLLMPSPPQVQEFTAQRRAMVAAGTVAVAAGDPWSALVLQQAGWHLYNKDQERQR